MENRKKIKIINYTYDRLFNNMYIYMHKIILSNKNDNQFYRYDNMVNYFDMNKEKLVDYIDTLTELFKDIYRSNNLIALTLERNRYRPTNKRLEPFTYDNHIEFFLRITYITPSDCASNYSFEDNRYIPIMDIMIYVLFTRLDKIINSNDLKNNNLIDSEIKMVNMMSSISDSLKIILFELYELHERNGHNIYKYIHKSIYDKIYQYNKPKKISSHSQMKLSLPPIDNNPKCHAVKTNIYANQVMTFDYYYSENEMVGVQKMVVFQNVLDNILNNDNSDVILSKLFSLGKTEDVLINKNVIREKKLVKLVSPSIINNNIVFNDFYMLYSEYIQIKIGMNNNFKIQYIMNDSILTIQKALTNNIDLLMYGFTHVNKISKKSNKVKSIFINYDAMNTIEYGKTKFAITNMLLLENGCLKQVKVITE